MGSMGGVAAGSGADTGGVELWPPGPEWSPAGEHSQLEREFQLTLAFFHPLYLVESNLTWATPTILQIKLSIFTFS